MEIREGAEKRNLRPRHTLRAWGIHSKQNLEHAG